MESDRVNPPEVAGDRRGRALVIVGSVLATAGITAASEGVARAADPIALVTILGFYLVTAGAITAFAVWTADRLGLPSFLLFEPLSSRERWRRLAIYGVGIGLLLAAASVLLAGAGSAALRPWFWRSIQSPAGTVLFSARASLLEETFFRLFLIPAIVALVEATRRPRYRLRLRDGAMEATVQEPGAVRPWAVVAAVVVSSLLFAIAHRFNPVSAMLLAPFLALSYLRGGWESAVVAHFIANWLVFSLYF